MPVAASSWLGLEPGHPFGLAALPYCSFSTHQHAAFRRAGVRIGDQVLDLTTATERLLPGRAALFRDGAWTRSWPRGTGRGRRSGRRSPRGSAGSLPGGGGGPADPGGASRAAAAVHRWRLHGLLRLRRARHQRRRDPSAGRRPAAAAAGCTSPPGYHGRAGSVVLSGTAIRRPCGLARPGPAPGPAASPARRSGRRRGWTSRPSWASSSEPGRCGRAGGGTGYSCARVRRVPARRLVGPRHPGLRAAPLGPFLGKASAHGDRPVGDYRWPRWQPGSVAPGREAPP